jgi:hypothetical protein
MCFHILLRTFFAGKFAEKKKGGKTNLKKESVSKRMQEGLLSNQIKDSTHASCQELLLPLQDTLAQAQAHPEV